MRCCICLRNTKDNPLPVTAGRTRLLPLDAALLQLMQELPGGQRRHRPVLLTARTEFSV